jgi:WD40 repeat protein
MDVGTSFASTAWLPDKYFALVVGISQYPSFGINLSPDVLKDAEDVERVLSRKDRGGYLPENVVRLPQEKATKNGIEDALAVVATKAKDSTLFVYFSGHGIEIKEGPYAGDYILPADGDVPGQNEPVNAIQDTEFLTWLDAIPARNVFVALDCCHAAGIVERTNPLIGVGLQGLENSLAGKGWAVLSAAGKDQRSWLGDGNSIFTRHLVDGLDGGIVSPDGLIRANQLLPYVSARVSIDASVSHHQRQEPRYVAGPDDDFPIAERRGGEAERFVLKPLAVPPRDPILHASALTRLEASLARQSANSSLVAQQQPGTIVAITGPAGVGKSRLARAYFDNHADEYPDGRYWVDASDMSLARGFSEIGRLIDGGQSHMGPLTEIERIRWAFAHLNRYPRALVVLDNVVNAAAVKDSLAGISSPSELRCDVIVTSRARAFPGYPKISLAPLPADAALELLRLQREPAGKNVEQDDHSTLQQICQMLDFLPLPLLLAARFLSEHTNVPAEHVLENLRSSRTPSVGVPDSAITAAVRLWWRAVDNDARTLLTAAALLPEGDVMPVARVSLLAGLSTSEFGPRQARALDQLQASSLLDLAGERGDLDVSARLHSAVRSAVLSLAGPGTQGWDADSFAQNIWAAIQDFKTIETHVSKRGIDAVCEDMRCALRLRPPPGKRSAVVQQLRSALRILEFEAANVRLWDPKQPARFAQLVHFGASLAGDMTLAEAAQQRLASQRWPHIEHRWTVGPRSQAQSELTIRAHNNTIDALALTADGRVAVSGGPDLHVRVWDTVSGNELRPWIDHQARVVAVAVLASGRRAASASADGVLKLWAPQSGEVPRDLSTTATSLRSLTFTPDGARLVAHAGAAELRVWDVELEQELSPVQLQTDAAPIVAFSSGGGRAVVVGNDSVMRVWNLQTGSIESEMSVDADTALLATDAGTRRLVCQSGRHAEIAVWDLATKQKLRTIAADLFDPYLLGGGSHAPLLLTHGGTLMIGVCPAGTKLVVYDVRTGKLIQTLSGHSSLVSVAAISSRGQHLMTGSWDGTLRVWNLDARHSPGPDPSHSDWVLDVGATADGQRALSASGDGTVKAWDLNTGEFIWTTAALESEEESAGQLKVTGARAVDAIGYLALPAAMSSVALSGSVSGSIRLHHLPSGQAKLLAVSHRALSALVVAPDGLSARSAFYDGGLTAWDLRRLTGAPVALGNSKLPVMVALTTDGRRAVFGLDSGRVFRWDLTTPGDPEAMGSAHDEGVTTLSIAPDGHLAISGARDGTLKIWNLEEVFPEKAENVSLYGHDVDVTAASLIGSSYAVSASFDGTLRIWDISTPAGGELAAVFVRGDPSCVAVGQDKSTIVVGDKIGNVTCVRFVADASVIAPG